MARLRRLPRSEMRVAFVLTNSGAKASQVGNAVGLDAPASLLTLLRAMRRDGYAIDGIPGNQRRADVRPARARQLRRPASARSGAGPAVLAPPLRGRIRADSSRAAQADGGLVGHAVDRGDALRDPARRIDKKIASKAAAGAAILAREPWSDDRDYLFAAMEIGQTLIALQPPRGYGMNPDAIYHTPDLPPTHHYAAFYRWLATPMADGGWGADAIVHVGKHGTLEWLPGKGVGLSSECFPDVLLGDVPLVYPFIVNDPGEGSQAKRRGHAVIVDHLMPAMTNADTYGPLASLNDLVNDYYSRREARSVEAADRPAADLGTDSADAAAGRSRSARDARARSRRSHARVGRRGDAGGGAGHARGDERQRRRPSDRGHRRLFVRAGHGADSRRTAHAWRDARPAGHAARADATAERAVPGLQASLAAAFDLDLEEPARGARCAVRRRPRRSRHALRGPRRRDRAPGDARRTISSSISKQTAFRNGRLDGIVEARLGFASEPVRAAAAFRMPDARAGDRTGDRRDRPRARRPGRTVCAARAVRRADARHGAHSADRPELLCGRSARAAVAGGVARRAAAGARTARASSRRGAALSRDDWHRRLGHVADAHAGRRYRGGARAARRRAGVGFAIAPHSGSRDRSARTPRASADRRHAAYQRLFPRRVSASHRRWSIGPSRWWSRSTSRRSRTIRASTIWRRSPGRPTPASTMWRRARAFGSSARSRARTAPAFSS